MADREDVGQAEGGDREAHRFDRVSRELTEHQRGQLTAWCGSRVDTEAEALDGELTVSVRAELGMRLRYKVHLIREADPESLLTAPGTAPFAVLGKVAGEAERMAVFRRSLQVIKNSGEPNRSDLGKAARIFAEVYLRNDQIRQIWKEVGIVMEALEQMYLESRYYHERTEDIQSTFMEFMRPKLLAGMEPEDMTRLLGMVTDDPMLMAAFLAMVEAEPELMAGLSPMVKNDPATFLPWLKADPERMLALWTMLKAKAKGEGRWKIAAGATAETGAVIWTR